MKKAIEKSWIGWVIGIWAIVMAGYWFWFFGSDRRLTFLYGHLHGTPYDAETLSRYLMTGLVVSGMIFVLYTAINLVMKITTRKKKNFELPDWQQIWKWSAVSLVLPLLIMLTGFGRPPLGIIMAIGTMTVLKADKNRNIWVCENDQWVAMGEPDYEKPFAEECGVIDKIIIGND